MAYKLQSNDVLTEFIREDLHAVGTAWRNTSQQISEKCTFLQRFLESNFSGNEPVLCCFRPAELRLSLGLRCVQEDGAERGQDLSGLGGGQLASGPHQTHAVSFPQGQDQTEGHRAPAAAVITS